MLNKFDLGQESMRQFQEDAQDERFDARNEATTRLHLVDRLFFDCLGWERADCTVEESSGGQYADYHFRAKGASLIVEAKKEGDFFVLPAGVNQRVHNISYFQQHVPNAYQAIEQAIGYCTSRGVQFGAIANGHQLIAFLGSRTDGVPPTKGKAMVFKSLQDMEANFLQLWQVLSSEGILQRNLLTDLRVGTAAPPPEKLSARLLNYPGYQKRNALQVDLQILSEILIQDIGRSPALETEFLEKCYTEGGALSQYALVSKAILSARYSRLGESELSGPSMFPATTKGGFDPHFLADAASSRPVLLIGDIGVGKTTFIRKGFIYLTPLAASFGEQDVTVCPHWYPSRDVRFSL